ncbi:hypothetical protein FO519_002523 [Halicephalobus sp. NKZ332]|nr:hypothetical protein FO519_002523 [Halicephalobus sp. NKZ332]
MLIPRRFCSNFSASNFKPILLGLEEMPQGKTRVVNSQKCIRAGGKHNDLEDVGKDNYHHTFFEMLGNWSFGDYYKKEACEYAWNYLTEILKIPGSRLYVTFFKGDSKLNLEPDLETFEIWKKIGLPVDRIIPSGAKDNFWEMAEFGPCGPCSEIHIDKKEDRPYSVPDLVNKDHPEVVELWNIVFMQYDKKRDSISNLPRKNIDCGMGFERLVSVLQKVDSNYDTDVFQPILKNISLFSKIGPYSGKLGKEDENEKDKAYRIIADHLRTVTISLADGVSPAGTDRGFVVRKMLRRAAMNSTNILKVERNSLSEISKSVILNLKDAYPELKENEEIIRKTIAKEEKNFWNIVDQGKKIFESMVSKLPKKASVFPGELAFELHDTYGFNIELTQKFAEKQGLNVDLEGFQKRREEASRLAKSQSKMKAVRT